MSPQERQRILVLAAVLLVPIGLWILVKPHLLALTDSGLSGGRAGERATNADQEVVELHLADLERAAAEYTPGRNLFAYGEPPAPPPPPPAPPPPPPPPPREPPPPPPPMPPRVDVKLLGIFGPERRRIAVFRRGETLINAAQGDVVEGKFIVAAIGFESVDLEFVGFPDAPAQRLPIGG